MEVKVRGGEGRWSGCSALDYRKRRRHPPQDDDAPSFEGVLRGNASDLIAEVGSC